MHSRAPTGPPAHLWSSLRAGIRLFVVDGYCKEGWGIKYCHYDGIYRLGTSLIRGHRYLWYQGTYSPHQKLGSAESPSYWCLRHGCDAVWQTFIYDHLRRRCSTYERLRGCETTNVLFTKGRGCVSQQEDKIMETIIYCPTVQIYVGVNWGTSSIHRAS